MQLLPPDLSPLAGLVLVALSFVTSAITAALGIGGGLTLIAVLSAVVPTAAVVPVHGIVQLGSNIGRVVIQRRHIDRPVVACFLLGSLAGAVVGGAIVVELPERVLEGVLAAFILYATWRPARFRLARAGRGMLALAGGVSTFLTMFVGATGSFVLSVLAPRLADRYGLIGTHAACMTFQHALKVLVFGLLGFAFVAWLPLLTAMVAAGFCGTLVGSKLLHRLPEAVFRKVLKAILSVLAINLLLGALGVFA